MCRDLLGFFECASVKQISRDAGGSEGVTGDIRWQTGISHPAFNHGQHLAAVHPVLRQAAVPIQRAEEGSRLSIAETGRD